MQTIVEDGEQTVVLLPASRSQCLEAIEAISQSRPKVKCDRSKRNSGC